MLNTYNKIFFETVSLCNQGGLKFPTLGSLTSGSPFFDLKLLKAGLQAHAYAQLQNLL